MKKKILVLILLLPFTLFAQKYITKNGSIVFYSSTAIENIEAHNNQVNAALDLATGEFVFKVLMKSFEFEKALMQEHFNENYVESDKYPNALFVGKITNVKEIDVTKNGVVTVQVEGSLTIKDVTKKINETGTITVKNGVLTGYSKFNIMPKNYNITIPKTVINNISENIAVTVNVILNKLNK